jgi:hypothetical protein
MRPSVACLEPCKWLGRLGLVFEIAPAITVAATSRFHGDPGCEWLASIARFCHREIIGGSSETSRSTQMFPQSGCMQKNPDSAPYTSHEWMEGAGTEQVRLI